MLAGRKVQKPILSTCTYFGGQSSRINLPSLSLAADFGELHWWLWISSCTTEGKGNVLVGYSRVLGGAPKDSELLGEPLKISDWTPNGIVADALRAASPGSQNFSRSGRS